MGWTTQSTAIRHGGWSVNRNATCSFLCLLFSLTLCTSIYGQSEHTKTNSGHDWKATKLKELGSKIEVLESQNLETSEWKARRTWLVNWEPGEMKASPSRARKNVPDKRLEPKLQSTLAKPIWEATQNKSTNESKAKEFSKFQEIANRHPADEAVQQAFLHWMDNDPQQRKQFLKEIDVITTRLTRLLEQPRERKQLEETRQVALEFTKYRRARALAYRELPDVVAKQPIKDPGQLRQDIQAAFEDLIEETGSGRTEFVLLEIRMLRRSGDRGRALELLEQFGNTILLKWYQKKRRDLLQELGWKAPYQEAAEIFADQFPDYVARERELKKKMSKEQTRPGTKTSETSRQQIDRAAPAKKSVPKEHFSPDQSVIYKSVGGIQLKLDVFLPKTRPDALANTAPAVVFFFGGGWNGGTTAQFFEQSRYLNEFGVVAFCADYRVRSRHKVTPFQCVADGKSAIRWVRQNAGKFGIDPNRIIAAGGSAGGHVAACTGVITGLDEAAENLDISSIPNAMVLFNPVLDTTKRGYGHKRFKKSDKTRISPCHQVRPGIVPTLLFHGTADRTVPFENAERFTRLMTEAGNRCDLVSFAGAGHGFFNGTAFRPNQKSDKHYRSTMESFVEFLRSLEFLPADAAKTQ